MVVGKVRQQMSSELGGSYPAFALTGMHTQTAKLLLIVSSAVLIGHGCFRAYANSFVNDIIIDVCIYCLEINSVEHIIFV